VASAELNLNHHYEVVIVTIAFGVAHALRDLPLPSQHDFCMPWVSFWNGSMYGFQFDFRTGLNSFSSLDLRINKCGHILVGSVLQSFAHIQSYIGDWKLRIFTSKRKDISSL
jgi:hypothetical protein